LDYTYSRDTNEFIHKEAQPLEDELVKVGFLSNKKLFLYKSPLEIVKGLLVTLNSF
jgi:hypothetical protein